MKWIKHWQDGREEDEPERREDELEVIGEDRAVMSRSLLDSDEVDDPDFDELEIVEWYTEEPPEQR